MRLLTSASPERWEEAAARAVVPLRVTRMSAGFRGSLTRREFDDGVWVVEARAGAHGLARTPQTIAASASDGVVLEMNVHGSNVVGQHGRRTVLRTGEGVLYDTRHPYRLVLPDENTSLLLHVPRSRMPLTDAMLREAVARKADARMASYGLLRGYVDLVLRMTATSTDPEARSLATRSLVDLASSVAASLAGTPTTRSREALLSTLQVTIHRELSDPELSPAFLSRRHHVSIRTVHSAFEIVDDTPSAYIRAQRLARARAMLRRPTLRIVDVALACGFRESSTFVRAFRRAHGMSPSEYRSLQQPS